MIFISAALLKVDLPLVVYSVRFFPSQLLPPNRVLQSNNGIGIALQHATFMDFISCSTSLSFRLLWNSCFFKLLLSAFSKYFFLYSVLNPSCRIFCR